MKAKRHLTTLTALAVVLSIFVGMLALASTDPVATPTWQELYLMNADEKVAPVKKDLEIYNIRGNNYMKVRDLGYLMDFGVTYDHDLKGVSIVKGEHSDGIQVSNAKATEKQTAKTGWSPMFVEGQKINGVTMYNIHGNNFVKIRDMAKVVGFGCIYSKDLKAVVLSPFFDYTANDVMTDGTVLKLRYNDGVENKAFAHKDVIKDTPVSIAKPVPTPVTPTPKPTPTPSEKIYGAGEHIPFEAGHYKAQIAIGEKLYVGNEALGCDNEYMVDKRMDMNGLGAIGKVAGKTTLYVPEMGNPSNERWITVDLTITEASSIPEEPVVPERPVAPSESKFDESEVYEKIMALKNDYPEGMTWTNDNKYKNGGGCEAFARICADAAFGVHRGKEIPCDTATAFSMARVGDRIRIGSNFGAGHTITVLKNTGNELYTVEGNVSSTITWEGCWTLNDLAAWGVYYLETNY